jgi:hypothetical protein
MNLTGETWDETLVRLSDREASLDLQDRSILAHLAAQEGIRKSRFAELVELFAALDSHASIDRDWLTAWKKRLPEIFEGQRRFF